MLVRPPWRVCIAFVLGYMALLLWAGIVYFWVVLLLNYVAVFWVNALRKGGPPRPPRPR